MPSKPCSARSWWHPGRAGSTGDIGRTPRDPSSLITLPSRVTRLYPDRAADRIARRRIRDSARCGGRTERCCTRSSPRSSGVPTPSTPSRRTSTGLAASSLFAATGTRARGRGVSGGPGRARQRRGQHAESGAQCPGVPLRAGLKKPLEALGEFVRAKRPRRLPVVLTRAEVGALRERLSGIQWLMASLLYGTGMRFMECVRLRIQDVDFDYRQIVVRTERAGARLL
jgi:hypothetical protein